MEVLIVVLLLAVLACVGFIAVRHQQTHAALVAMKDQQQQVADFEAVIRDTVGALTTDEWHQITSGNMEPLRRKVQEQFAIAQVLNPVHEGKRRQLEKRIARLDAAAQQADVSRISYGSRGYRRDAETQDKLFKQYIREADELRAELEALV